MVVYVEEDGEIIIITEKVLCKEIDEDITIDVDASGKLTGIEVLSASEHI